MRLQICAKDSDSYLEALYCISLKQPDVYLYQVTDLGRIWEEHESAKGAELSFHVFFFVLGSVVGKKCVYFGLDN